METPPPPHLADGAEGEAEGDAWPHPSFLQHHASTVQVEHVATLQLDGRRRRQRLREADHAHVVGVLLQGLLVPGTTAVQTRQALLLLQDTAARVAALQRLHTRLLGMGLLG